MINLRQSCLITIFWTFALSVGISNVSAQGNYQYSDKAIEKTITVYEDCEFRGKSWKISVGDYRNIERLGIENDSISSIRVPRDFEVILYKDDEFEGDYVRIDRDVVCFNERWNDEASSLRVVYFGSSSQSNEYRSNEYRDSRQQNTQHDNKRSPRGNQINNVNSKNVSRVIFDNRVLQQIAPRQWQMVNGQYGIVRYKEVSRDSNGVYLQNTYTAEKVRIDLRASDVVIVNRNGQIQRYAINGLQAGLASGNRPVDSNRPQARPAPNSLIRGKCFRYKAYTRGGIGGIRFYEHDGFNQFNKKSHSDRICHQGALTMEISKQDPSTEVVVEIDGRRFKFASNEQHTAFKNTWYRKLVTLKVQK